MGGRGSGQWYRWNTKASVDSCLWLDIGRWQREGWLRPGCAFRVSWSQAQGAREKEDSIRVRVGSGSVELSYSIMVREATAGEHFRYPVALASTPCNYGG